MGETTILLATDLANGGFGGEAEERRRAHYRLVRDVAGEVRGLGDALLVTFDDPEEAFTTLAALRAAAARHNRRHPELGLDVRVGIHAGEAIRSEEDYLGESVLVVRRLCAAADGGKVLASAQVEKVGVPDVSFDASTTVDVGGGQAVKGFEVAVPVAVQPPVPLVLGERRPLVERSELDLALERWRVAVETSQPSTLWVRGRAGAGKTMLAGQLARRAHADGAIVLYAACRPDGFSVRDALRSYVERCPRRILRDLARVVPGLGSVFEGLDVPTGPKAPDPVEVATAVLLDMTIDAPVLLVVDDVHDADAASVDVLERLTRSPEAAPLLIAATYDPDALRHDHPVTGQLATGTRVVLSVLDQGSIADLLCGRVGAEAETLASHVLQATGGNALLVEDAIRRLAAAEAEDRGSIRIAEGVLEAIGARMAAVDEDVRAAVAAVAEGGPADPEALDRAVDAGVVDRVGEDGFVVTHPLVREAVEGPEPSSGGPIDVPTDLTEPAVFEITEALLASGAERDGHVQQEPEPEPAAEEEEEESVRRTPRRRIDPMVHLRRFPSGVDVEAARADLEASDEDPFLTSLVAAHEARITDGIAAAAEAHAAAERSADERLTCVADVLSGWHQWASGRIGEGLDAIDGAWQAADAVDDPVAAPLAATAGAWAHMLVLDMPGARGLLLREVGQRRAADSSDERRMLTDTLAAVGVLSGRRSEGQRLCRHADLDPTYSAGRPLVAAASGDWDEAERLWLGVRERLRKGDAKLGWWSDCLMARVLRVRGGVGLATALLEESLLGLTGNVVPAELWVRVELALIAASGKDVSIAAEHLERCDELMTDDQWRGLAGRVELAWAATNAATGDLTTATERFENALAAFARYTLPWDEAEALTFWGRALLDADRPEGSAKLEAAERVYRDCRAGAAWRELIPA